MLFHYISGQYLIEEYLKKQSEEHIEKKTYIQEILFYTNYKVLIIQELIVVYHAN